MSRKWPWCMNIAPGPFLFCGINVNFLFNISGEWYGVKSNGSILL